MTAASAVMGSQMGSPDNRCGKLGRFVVALLGGANRCKQGMSWVFFVEKNDISIRIRL